MSLQVRKHPKTYDVWVRIEVDQDDGRVTGSCGMQGEEEYASVYGAQDYWTTMHALTPYIAVLCAEDPFGLVPKP